MNNLDSSDVVQELELKMNLALYGLVWSLGNQYIEGSLSWRSFTFTANLIRQIFSSIKPQFQHIKVRCKGSTLYGHFSMMRDGCRNRREDVVKLCYTLYSGFDMAIKQKEISR